MALGLAEKELTHWDQALYAFSMAHLTDNKDPLALLSLTEAYIALGQKADAEECIEDTLNVLKNKDDDTSKQILNSILTLKKRTKELL